MLSDNSLRQTVHTHRTAVHQAAKLVAALLRVVRVTLPFSVQMVAEISAENNEQKRSITK